MRSSSSWLCGAAGLAFLSEADWAITLSYVASMAGPWGTVKRSPNRGSHKEKNTGQDGLGTIFWWIPYYKHDSSLLPR